MTYETRELPEQQLSLYCESEEGEEFAQMHVNLCPPRDNMLKVGQIAPDICLRRSRLRQPVYLSELVKSGTVVLVVFRGQWCPLCNSLLRSIQQCLPELKQAGAELVCLSPQTPEASLAQQHQMDLPFELLSDPGNSASKTMGLTFPYGGELRAVYEGKGIHLGHYNGDSAFDLPVPSTFVIDSAGIIQFAHANPDITKQPKRREILAAVRRCSGNYVLPLG